MPSKIKKIFKFLFRRRRKQAHQLTAEAMARAPLTASLSGHRMTMDLHGDWTPQTRTKEEQARYEQLLERNKLLKERNIDLLARNALLLEMLLMTELDAEKMRKMKTDE